MSTPHIDKELIKKYLNGSVNAVEKDLVERFMLQEGAKDKFDKVWQEWHPEMDMPHQAKLSDPARMERWKTTIRQKIEQDFLSQQAGGHRSLIFKQAAIWTILLLCGALWGTSAFLNRQSVSDTEWITHITPNGKKAVIRLSDSTMVYLGAGSSLRYPKRFGGDTREVQLEGEAFFEVAKDPEKRFLVVSGEVITQVLGTSFKVASFEGLPTQVSVCTGQVRVLQISNDQEQILADLTPGQQLIWNEKMGVAKTDLSASPTSAEDFMGGKLIFEDSPLLEITKTLERNYNVEIDIQRSALYNKQIRITLEKDLALRQVMEVLAASGGFSYALDKGHIKIF